MKFALYVLLALIAFVGVIVAALAATGNLNEEGLQKIINPQPPEAADGAGEADELDALARALKEREQELNEREAELVAREERLGKHAAEVEQDLERVEETLALIEGQLAQADAGREERLQQLASSLGEMSPKNAAPILEEMEPAQAAEALLRIKDRDRGKILDSMDTDKAYRIIRILQQESI